MSAGAITAGEAYVSVTCDNAELVAGLRESSATIQTTARNVAAMEDALTVNVGVEGVAALESALTRIEGAVKRTGVETAAAFAIAPESPTLPRPRPARRPRNSNGAQPTKRREFASNEKARPRRTVGRR